MFYASLSLSEILNLILLIWTLVSVLVPWIPSGAFLAVTVVTPLPPVGAGPAGAAGVAAGAGVCFGAAAGYGVLSAFGAATGSAAAGAFGAAAPPAPGLPSVSRT